MTDPDSGVFQKGEHRKCFAYEAHTVCDRRGYVLETEATPGNVHDSVAFDTVFESLIEHYPEVQVIYLLYGDNTEAMAFEQSEILNHDGIFGIDRTDWETVKEQFSIATESKWQKAFLENPADGYCIYQLKRKDETAELLFMSSNYLKGHNLDISYENYDAVYAGQFSNEDDLTTLDDLYMKFNADRPP